MMIEIQEAERPTKVFRFVKNKEATEHVRLDQVLVS